MSRKEQNDRLYIPGSDLHLLLLPILVRETLLDHGGHPDDDPGPLLVHPGLHRLEGKAGSHDYHNNGLFCQAGWVVR